MPRPLSLTVVATGALLTLALAPGAQARTIVGTPAADHLAGHDPRGDLIVGSGGNDTLQGGPGPDRIYGVRANNLITGGRGDNYVEGGTGDDRISAKDGDNTVYGGPGRDGIRLGDGDNYVDPGAGDDTVDLGDGANVVNGGTGGLALRAGDGDNTVYLRSGPDQVQLGGGVNTVYLAVAGQFAHIDCGGNPASVLAVNAASDPDAAHVRSAVKEGKVVGCPTIRTFVGPAVPMSIVADPWQAFALVGGDGPDQLAGGHGGGTISAGAGDNLIWADRSPKAGGAFAAARTTTITAGDGDNEIHGGRGTNVITVGAGRNFITGGRGDNLITTGAGRDVVRLSGRGKSKVYLNGGRHYVESFVRGDERPDIFCRHGAKATIVFGVRAPLTHHCGRSAAARASSPEGRLRLVQGLTPLRDSDPVVFSPLRPGAGAGVPRP